MDGYIRQENGKQIGYVEGAGVNLRYEGLTLKFWLEIVNGKTNPNAPDFEVLTMAHGAILKVGSAWEKRNDQGEVFLSVTFDDKSLPHKIYVNAYGNPDGEGFVFGARKKQAA